MGAGFSLSLDSVSPCGYFYHTLSLHSLPLSFSSGTAAAIFIPGPLRTHFLSLPHWVPLSSHCHLISPPVSQSLSLSPLDLHLCLCLFHPVFVYLCLSICHPLCSLSPDPFQGLSPWHALPSPLSASSLCSAPGTHSATEEPDPGPTQEEAQEEAGPLANSLGRSLPGIW